MDYVTAQYLSNIEANRPEVEAEYQLVLKQAEENRQGANLT
jgi:hypothetical protein